MPTRLFVSFSRYARDPFSEKQKYHILLFDDTVETGSPGTKIKKKTLPKNWFLIVRIVYKPKTKCASAIGRNKPTASLTTTQLH